MLSFTVPSFGVVLAPSLLLPMVLARHTADQVACSNTLGWKGPGFDSGSSQEVIVDNALVRFLVCPGFLRLLLSTMILGKPSIDLSSDSTLSCKSPPGLVA